MAECEQCYRWQHVKCMFGVDDEKVLPEHYYCNECKPELYPNLVSSNAAVNASSSNSQSVVDSKDSAGKSTADVSINEEPVADSNQATAGPSLPSTGLSEPSSAPAGPSAPSVPLSTSQSRKETVPAAKKRKISAELPIIRIQDLKDNVRRSVGNALYAIFLKAIVPEAIKNQSLKLKEKISPEQFSERISLQIEKALYDKLANKGSKDVGSKYRDKFRTISFNLKDNKNPELRTKLVTGDLTPEAIVMLTNEEMLNPELQKLAESVRAESIRESVLKVDDAPRIRKTHKGEEIVGGDEEYERREGQNNSAQSLQQQNSDLNTDDNNNDNNEGSDKGSLEPPGEPWRPQDNLNNDIGMPSDMDVLTYSPAGSPRETGDVNQTSTLNLDDDDEDFDLILKQDETDNAKEDSGASLTTTLPPEITVWNGHLTMPGITEFTGKAHHLNGARNFKPTESWSLVLNGESEIVVEGRLDESRAAKYLRSLGISRDVVTIYMSDVDPVQSGFNKLFEYFHSRNKFGVIKNRTKIVKDAYLIPLSPQDAIPDYLRMDKNATDQLKRFQELDLNIIIGLFVIVPFRADSISVLPAPNITTSSISANSIPSITSTTLPSFNNTPPAYPTAIPSDNNILGSVTGLSSGDFQLLQNILAANPDVANNPSLPNNPTMLFSLLQNLNPGGATKTIDSNVKPNSNASTNANVNANAYTAPTWNQWN